MKLSDLNIVWSAVATVVFTLSAFVCAATDNFLWVFAFGFASVASATLASRER